MRLHSIHTVYTVHLNYLRIVLGGTMVIEFFDIWQNYIPLSIIAVAIAVAIIAIVYYISKIFSNKMMSDWAAYEVYQAFGSVVIIALIAISLQMINTVLLLLLEGGVDGFNCIGDTCTYTTYQLNTSIQGQFDIPVAVTKTCNKHCHIEVAKSYLDTTYSLVSHYAAAQLCTAGWLELWAEASINFDPLKSVKYIGKLFSNKLINVASLNIAVFSGCQLIDMSYESMITYLTTLLGIIKANQMMLVLVENAIFPIFLVLGVILRTFSFTRKIGGLLIAMAVALYFFYPAVVILQGTVISPDSNMVKLRFTTCPGDVSIYNKIDPATGAVTTPLNIFTVNDGGSRYGICPWVGWDASEPGGIIDTTAAISVWIFIQFIILIYLTASFIMSLSPLFGGDIDIAGLSRLL